MVKRREFVRLLSGVAGATFLGSCLDDTVSVVSPGLDPTPPEVNPDLRGVCDPTSTVTLGDVSVSTHPWPGGIDAAALIDVDDLCPVSSPGDGLDFGGDLSSNGILGGFLTDQLAATYPEAKVSLMTIANMRQNPVTRTAIAGDDRYLLSRQLDWAEAVRGILNAYPNFRLSMHGFWHFNYLDGGAAEFNQYSDLRARAVMRQMHLEFLSVLPMVEPVFRAPGWATTPGVLQYVAEAGLLLADSSITPTFAGSVPSCDQVTANEDVVRAGPDFNKWIADGAQGAGLIVGHFHFTAPNPNNLGSAIGRKTALDFAKAVRNTTQYRIGWLSYYEAARWVALARAAKWSAALDGNALKITVTPWDAPLHDVTLAIQSLAGRDVVVQTTAGDPVPFRLLSSNRGCNYVVLDA